MFKSAHSGNGTYFDEPRLEVAINKDVIAIALEAVPVVDHYVLHAAQAVDDHLVDALEQPDDDEVEARGEGEWGNK